MATPTLKEPVRLRERPLKSGNISLYLDIYTNGKRHYDFLGLYLVPEQTAKDRAQNKQTLALANAIKSQRIVDIQYGKHRFRVKRDMRLSDFAQTEIERYRSRGSENYAGVINNVLNHIIKYSGEETLFSHIDRQYILGYINYLNTARSRFGRPFSSSSRKLHLQVFIALLNRAVKEGIIPDNPIHTIGAEDRPTDRHKAREFLTPEELSQLMHADYDFRKGKYIDIRQAFLFSCFSGLRISDIRALRWGNIHKLGEDNYIIRLTQQKTKELIDIPLSSNALAQLPANRGRKNDSVFNIPESWHISYEIARWVKSAGIEKHITFHCARHTHATLLLTYGADIYTVSKLLGHTRVQTTEIHAKIIDDKKRQAVDLIPTI